MVSDVAGTPGPAAQPVYTVRSVSGSAASPFGSLVRAFHDARQTAITRMVAECVALGGHGVVGVQFDVEPFPAGGLELKARVRALRVRGRKSASDQLAQATIVGTAITRFGGKQARLAPLQSNMILSLGDRDRP
jgi:hypothetical protein